MEKWQAFSYRIIQLCYIVKCIYIKISQKCLYDTLYLYLQLTLVSSLRKKSENRARTEWETKLAFVFSCTERSQWENTFWCNMSKTAHSETLSIFWFSEISFINAYKLRFIRIDFLFLGFRLDTPVKYILFVWHPFLWKCMWAYACDGISKYWFL